MDQELKAYLDTRFDRIDQRFKRLAEGVIGLGERLQAQNSELMLRLDQVQVSIAPYFADLNRRVRVLEERAERERQSPLDYIREHYGKTSI